MTTVFSLLLLAFAVADDAILIDNESGREMIVYSALHRSGKTVGANQSHVIFNISGGFGIEDPVVSAIVGYSDLSIEGESLPPTSNWPWRAVYEGFSSLNILGRGVVRPPVTTWVNHGPRNDGSTAKKPTSEQDAPPNR